MTKIRVLAWVAVCLLTATSAVRAQNSLDVLKVIPASADGFAVIAKLGDLDKKVGALAKKLNVPVGSVLDLAKGVGIEGLDPNGSAAAIVFAPMGEKPVVVGVIPVADFDAALKAVKAKNAGEGVHEFQVLGGLDMVIAKKGAYALVAQDENRAHLVKALKSETSVVGQAKGIERWLALQDVAAVILEKTVKEFAKKAVESIPQELPGVPEDQAKQIKGQLDIVRGLAKSGASEFTHLALGLGIDGELNGKLSFNAGFVNGGSFSKWASVPPKESPLTGLPSGAYAFAFGGTFTPESMLKLMNYSMEASKAAYKLSDAEANELGKIWADAVKGMRSTSMSLQVPKAGESIFDATVAVLRVDDAKEYLKTYREAVVKGYKIMKIDAGLKEVKVGPFDGFEMALDMKSIVQQRNDPNAEKVLEKLFGSADKITTTVVAVDANTLLLGYVPAAKMKALVEGYANRPTLAKDALSAKTLKLLPENSFMIALVSPKEVAAFAAKMGKDFDKELPIPAVGETPPIGFAASGDATSFQFHAVAPVEVFVEIGRIVQQFLGQ